MKTTAKIAWLIGSKLSNPDFEEAIRERGYEIQGFYANQTNMLSDDYPSLIVLSEEEMSSYQMVIKFHDFYPETPVMCLPANQIEMMIARKVNERQPVQQQPVNEAKAALHRLINSIQQIEEETQA